MSSIKTELEKHISNSGINCDELRKNSWRETYERDLNIMKQVAEDPITKFRTHFYNLSREDMFKYNIMRAARMKELGYEGKVPHVDKENYGTFSIAINSLYPTSVHHGMFESIVKVLGSDQQVSEVWDDIVDYKILGCYAQTEIGHGSDVQGLETEAIYDEATEEFIINSPSVKAYKFWPGDLGKMANHAVVFAKMIIKGEAYGIHAFFFRIRDSESHTPLKGIEIGDIGPKYGYPYKDNGYMAFSEFRVPRSAILSRYVSVSKDGMIELKGDPRIGYATMLWIRVQLLFFGWQVKFSNIAQCMRYTLKRKQFKSLPGTDIERPIFDYQATQDKIVSAICYSYANLTISHFCMDTFYKMEEKVKNEDFSMMNDLHVLISSLKAYCMDYDMTTLYNLRELQGGHGYLYLANIPGWIDAWSPNVTLEGDGYVLFQQTSRKLMKKLKSVAKGKSIDKTFYPYMDQVLSVEGLTESDADIRETHKLCEILRVAISYELLGLSKNLTKEDQHSFDTKWNKIYQVELANLAKLHAVYMTSLSFADQIPSLSTDKLTQEVLTKVCNVYITEEIMKFAQTALLEGYINGEQMVNIQNYRTELVESLKPHVIALAESQVIHDRMTQSTALSGYDSDYASNLYEMAMQNTLNATHKMPNIDRQLKPLSKKLSNFAKI
ncbi:unnamed protein product [Moneuplotes crassus]|uniref:Acyl-coenzyme A oxidase n=1 Tax=Euplotes crassus TaxID=5936 RepID=A0AAD1U3P5_EUPCR|nr:unnamed protein product [Moneuplotes crassus]